MILPCNNPSVYKDYVIYYIASNFGGGDKIIHWMENMNPYVSDNIKPYKRHNNWLFWKLRYSRLVYINICKGMYELKQSGIIANLESYMGITS